MRMEWEGRVSVLMIDSELKQLIIDDFCFSEYDLDDIEVVRFYCWLIWALGLTNS